MFSKLKIAVRGGNKKQRALNNELAKSEMGMAIKITQLELMEKKTIKPYIQEITDNNEFPTYTTRRAMYMTAEMTEADKKAKIEFLKKQGITTNYDNEDRVSFTEKVE